MHSSKKVSSLSATLSSEDIGAAVRRLRQVRHLRQADLATLAHATPAQISTIENGKTVPTLPTLDAIAQALDVTLSDLLSPRAYVERATPPASSCPRPDSPDAPYARLLRHGVARVVHIPDEARALTSDFLDTLEQRILDQFTLEDLCGVCKQPALPLRIPFPLSSEGAAHLAYAVRLHCGVGSAIVLDFVELLENQGLRVLFLDLPSSIQSLAFYDTRNANAFIVLPDTAPPEKQLFRMAVELAGIYLFTANHGRTVSETARTRRFAKQFAANLLVPSEAVRASALQLGLAPDQWTYPLLLRLKQRFGVSTEFFAHRLEEIGALDKALRQRFKRQILDHYAATKYAEPGASARPLSKNSRLGDLYLTAIRLHPTPPPPLVELAPRARAILPELPPVTSS